MSDMYTTVQKFGDSKLIESDSKDFVTENVYF